MTASTTTRLVKHVSDPLFRHGYTLIINTVVTSGLGVLYWLLAARLFAPADVGLNASVISSLVFLSGLAQLNLRPVLGRFVPIAGLRTGWLVSGVYLCAAATAVAAALVFLLGSDLWASSGPIPAIRNDAALAAAFVVATIVWTIFALQDGVLVGLRRTGLLTAENTAFGLAKIALLVVAAAGAATFRYGIVATWFIPMAIAVAVITVLLARWLVPAHVREAPAVNRLVRPGPLARFAAVDYVGSLFALTYVALLPVLVIDRIGPEAGGHFYIVWVVASSLQLMAPQLVASLTVETARDPSTLRNQGRRLAIGMLRVVVPVCLGVVVLAPLVLSIFGPTYATEADLLRLLAAAIIPYSVNVLAIGVARITIRPGLIVAMQGALAISIVGLTILLLGPLGLNAVGVAFLVGQGLVAAVVAVTVLRPIWRR